MRRALLFSLVALVLLAASAAAQPYVPETPPFLLMGTDPPFLLRVDEARTKWLPDGRTVTIGFVLDVAEHHKVYRNELKMGIAPLEGATVMTRLVPPGVDSKDPTGEIVRLLKGRSELSLEVRFDKAPESAVTLRPTVEFLGCSETTCFPPTRKTFEVEVPPAGSAGAVTAKDIKPPDSDVVLAPPGLTEPDKASSPTTSGPNAEYDFVRILRESGPVVAVLTAFAWGVVVSFTPCVWPLVPIVLSVVGASGEGAGWKRGLGLSLLYVLGMALTFAALCGIIAAAAQTVGVDRFLTSPWLMGAVSLVFVALALSMFGLYDITLPSSWTSRLQGARKTGLLGVLVMGVISGLVASPCVSAPALGLFTGIALKGSLPLGIFAGAAFGFGLGAILVVAGTSSKALQALPRSGEWMVRVKHFFGWVMLGAAVYIAHIVIGAAAYRIAMGVYLISAGITAGALRATAAQAGWPTRLAQVAGIVLVVLGVMYLVVGAGPLVGLSMEHADSGIAWVRTAEVGFARIDAEKKPAVIDFWADWCTLCTEMDLTVLQDAAVVAESRRFVMVKVDIVNDPTAADLKQRYGFERPPAYVFIPTVGEPIVVNSTIARDRFLELMRETR